MKELIQKLKIEKLFIGNTELKVIGYIVLPDISKDFPIIQ